MAIVRKELVAVLFAILSAVTCFGQTVDEQRTIFTEAESHYLFGEYELATPLYLILNEFIPDNYNIKFKIGNSYLNTPDERSKAIPYLEDAVRNTSITANPESFREMKAPMDAWFALATAYRINNELDKALITYQNYLKLTSDGGQEVNTEFVNQQINACKIAIRQIEQPVDIEKINLGSLINQGSVNFSPAVSFDGNSMVYTESRGLENAIFYTIKERGVWQTPVEITSQLGDGKDCSSSSLNANGTELYLYKTDNFDGNIYVSNLVDGVWSKIRRLNRNINTRYYESHAAVSSDGNKLYFTSNRPGGYGELDIYVSTRSSGDNWGVPVNVGAVINTPFNENTPFITKNDSLIYFASEGHSSMGGYDLYSSLNLGPVWKSPDNLGYPINSTDDDLFFQPFDNGISGYYSIHTGYKNSEIFLINIGKKGIDNNFEIRGYFSLADTIIRFNEDYQINLINLINGDTLDTAFPNEFSGLYTFITKPGLFRIKYNGIGYLSQTIDTTITSSHPSTVITINVQLAKDPDYVVNAPVVKQEVYEKINLSVIPTISSVDTSMLFTDLILRDISDMASADDLVLYYTVQVIALYNPVDVSYFTHISDIAIMYNEADKFYRYTTGKFQTREEAYAYRLQLIEKGYPNDIFIKKVFRE
jgi:hypothetical protein